MSSRDPEQMFAMSAFEAAVLISTYRAQNPTLSNERLIELLRAIRSDFFANDYEAGLLLESWVGVLEVDAPREAAFRKMIDTLIAQLSPVWIRLARGGRDKVLQGLSDRGRQCFKSAGLLESPPPEDVRLWWDSLAGRARGQRDAELLEQGREAERLSIEREKERLASLGISLEPKWVAIEDNGAGYDILSYDPGVSEPGNRLIEVKSSTAHPPVIYLTRHEWRAAIIARDKYFFHVWSFPAKVLETRTVEQLARHVPTDNGEGEWERVVITIT